MFRLAHNTGDIIGRQYKILEKIKTGGMSSVYKVEDIKINAVYACKEMDLIPDRDVQGFSRDELLKALLDNHIDIIATDHAPHTHEEKQNLYLSCPSGGPLVQHALPAMLEMYHQHKISIERIVEKFCHAPADCFQIANRGYIREGYFADLVLVDMNARTKVSKENILYKCGWSPFEGHEFPAAVRYTFVNGEIAYENGRVNDGVRGRRLAFER